MSSKLKLHTALFIAPLVLVLLPAIATASDCKNSIAIAISVQGIIEEKRETLWTPVKRNDTFCAGDIVRVRKNSRAIVRLIKEQTNITLTQHSTIIFSEQKENKSTWLELLKGAANFISRVPQALKIKTPYVNAAIEGTEFLITTEEGQSQISVFEGHVALSNEKGKLDLKSGDTGIAKAGQAPAQSIKVDQVDAVQWTMYYPPIISKPTVSKQKKAPDEDFPPTLDNDNDPKLLTYYASQFLAVGSIDQAEQNIEKALSIDRGNSNALALKSIIAIVKNDKESALKLAKQAVKDNQSAAAQIALSYAHQAHFDLDAALNAAKQATQIESDNGIAWARLAELRLSQGDLDNALKAARQATKLNPNLAHTQTILGFSYLTKIKTGKAKTAFEKAISLDQAAPLPHLGLGLAIIREGNLVQGRIEIETATSLDPRNSLIRSYMGKAYYEEKRNLLAADQYSLAKQLDPHDPTPWFYDAIRKQTHNQPVTALHDLEKSIELNDNRAVYRSRLLLDEDQAARSTSLARVYQDLGFKQLALIEGWKSVNTDPSNYSSHRLLADSYSALPRHEIARVSELLQSQLLQPLNVNPLQPQLGESNLMIAQGAGPSNSTFNEFNPLFTRNQMRFQANAIGGSNNTWGDDLVLSGIQDKLSYSIGQFHYESDGFRQNNDQEQNLYNAFLQLSLSPNASIQLEARSRDIEFGDLQSRFDDSFMEADRRNIDTDTLRIGAKLSPSVASNVLISISFEDETDINHLERTSPPFGPFVDPIITVLDSVTNNDGLTLETQYLYKANRAHITAGASYFSVDKTVDRTSTSSSGGIPLPLPPIPPTPKDDIEHSNAYMYSTWTTLPELKLTFGISYDDFDSNATQISNWNPKLGLVWNATPQTTLRVAGFKVLRRSLFRGQTIEPTQVSGFNQFFDDFEATESTRFGIGLDHKLRDDLYAGIELTERDLEVPSGGIEIQQDESLHRAYLYWAPNSTWAFRAEYQYDNYETDITFGGLDRLRTQLLPLAMHYYHSNRLFARFGISYVDQEVNVPMLSNEEQFWVADTSVGYRLAKRRGIVSLLIKNLFDKSFSFQDDNPRTNEPRSPIFQPERTVFIQFSLAI